jgi:hypothetical protein
MNIDSAPATSAISRVFQYQLTYSVRSNSLLKFSRLAPFGISWAVLRVPIGLIAAENRNRIGKSPKNSATQAIRCRQPTCLHHPPLALPRRTTASFWSSAVAVPLRMGMGSDVSEGGMSSDIS